MPRKQVDRPPLPVDRIRHFANDLPAVLVEQTGRGPSTRVPLVEQPVQIPAAPPDEQHELRVERAGDRSHPPDGHVLEMTPLRPRDRVLAHARPRTKVLLAPREALAERANGPAGAKVVHRASVRRCTHHRLTRRPPRQYAASFRIPSAIFSGLTMNQSSRTWLYGTPGTSGPAIRLTGPSRKSNASSATIAQISAP